MADRQANNDGTPSPSHAGKHLGSGGKATPTKRRDPLWDNVRGILITLVVFGHLIELYPADSVLQTIYRVIYTFHMPAFLFVSGYFARYDAKRALRSSLLPYLVFQPIYLLVATYVVGQYETFGLQFTTPYWILWYLITLMFYHAAIPFLSLAKSPAQKVGTVAALCLVALIAGYDETLTRYLSLSRVVYFAPFYATGLYLGEDKQRGVARRPVMRAMTLMAFLFLVFVQLRLPPYAVRVLYGVAPYSEGYDPLIKLRLILQGFAGIGLLACWTPNIRIPLLTGLGQRTFSVFLLHGLFVKCLLAYGVPALGTAAAFSFCLLVTIGLLACLGNPPVAKVFSRVFR